MADIHEAVKAGDLQRLKALVAAGHSVNEPDEVPLRLLASGEPGESIYEPDGPASLPLDYALEGEHPGVLDFLLERGARTTLFETTLGLWAISHETEEMIAVMVKHCHLGLPDDLPMTALHDAVEGDSPYAIRLLLARGADTGLRSRMGETPLEMAQRLGRVRCISELSVDAQ